MIFASTPSTPNVATAYSHDPQTCALCWGIIPPGGVTMVPEDGEVCQGHRAHEANPILVAFRAGQFDLEWFLYEYNHDTDSWVWTASSPTAEQSAHARAVLARYLAVFS